MCVDDGVAVVVAVCCCCMCCGVLLAMLVVLLIVGVRVYGCDVCVDCVVVGCVVADDGCAVGGGDGVCYRGDDRCVGAGVAVGCVGGVGAADAAGDVVVDVW